MLVEFSVGNYLSFKERQTLSLVASNDAHLKTNTFSVPGMDDLSLVKSVAVYGANASGKSNLLKALNFMRTFVLNSATGPKQGDGIPVIPFRLDHGCLDQPSEFEVVFVHGGERYVYGFRLDRERIHEEWLTAARLGAKRITPRLLFSRTADNAVEFGGASSWQGEKKRLARQVRPNALLLSVAVQLNNPTATQVSEWFENNLEDVPVSTDAWSSAVMTSHLLREVPEFSDHLTSFMKVADLGIRRWVMERNPVPPIDGFEELPEDQRERLRRFFSDWHDPKAVHVDSSGNEVLFDLQRDESAGTRQLYSLAGRWISTLRFPHVLVKDELEASLHPLMTHALAKMINDAPGTPQVVFTTHESSLLDPDLMRRDQIWFAEKKPDGSTELYSLWAFRPRKDGNYRLGYLQGRYGAVPFIGEWSFEEAETGAARQLQEKRSQEEGTPSHSDRV